MLLVIVHGLPISIDCTREGHLVDAYLPEVEEVIDYDFILVVAIEQLPEPFDQYFV